MVILLLYLCGCTRDAQIGHKEKKKIYFGYTCIIAFSGLNSAKSMEQHVA